MNSLSAKAFLALALAASMPLASCESVRGEKPAAAVGSNPAIYHYKNRVFTGGRYETGSFFYSGKAHSNRYYFNGRYYYGGRLEQNPKGRLKLVPPAPPSSRKGHSQSKP